MMYQLEKYKNRSSRHICPMCEDKYSFVYYVDENNTPLNENVGRCNHESSCGYHYTPKDYFRDNPTEKKGFRPIFKPKIMKVSKPLCTIHYMYLCKTISGDNNLIYYLSTLFDKQIIERLIEEYYMGSTENKEMIFWQVDINSRVRTGKIQGYDSTTGKRIKKQPTDYIDWVHSRLKKQDILSDSWELTQCLYGEHLLTKHPNKIVALVEGEKNALFGSAMFPEYIWLATGSKQGLQVNKLRVLNGRTVILFPDADAYELWKEKSKLFTFCKVMVSDLTIKYASDEEVKRGYDITDYITKLIRNND